MNRPTTTHNTFMQSRLQRMNTLFGYEGAAIIAHMLDMAVEDMASSRIGCAKTDPIAHEVILRWELGDIREGDGSYLLATSAEARIVKTLRGGVQSQEVTTEPIEPEFYNPYLFDWIDYAVRLSDNATRYQTEQKALARETQPAHCAICGNEPDGTPKRQLCVDHIIPGSRGGASHISNFQILCRSCNSRKGNRMPEKKLTND